MSAIDDHKPDGPEEREMWAFMRATQRFTMADVSNVTSASDWKRQNYCGHLRREGLLKRCARVGPLQFFTVMNAAEAQSFTAKKRSTKEGAMWAALRTMVTFTPEDLLMTLGTPEIGVTSGDIRKYCAILLRAQYLAVVEKARPGVRSARYRLVRNTGPLPPTERNLKVIVDNNEERAVHVNGVRI